MELRRFLIFIALLAFTGGVFARAQSPDEERGRLDFLKLKADSCEIILPLVIKTDGAEELDDIAEITAHMINPANAREACDGRPGTIIDLRIDEGFGEKQFTLTIDPGSVVVVGGSAKGVMGGLTGLYHFVRERQGKEKCLVRCAEIAGVRGRGGFNICYN